MNFFSILFSNPKTTWSGVVMLLGGICTLFPATKPYAELVMGAGGGMLGLTAKDYNVTGGSIPQTEEAKSRSYSPPV